VRIARLEAIVLRCPIETPVRTSFGTMRDRPRSSSASRTPTARSAGARPGATSRQCGAEHRARLLETVIAPLAVGQRFASPAAAFDALSRATAVLAIQSGEAGPLAQAIAGVDLRSGTWSRAGAASRCGNCSAAAAAGSGSTRAASILTRQRPSSRLGATPATVRSS
jgi:hypothetical protein